MMESIVTSFALIEALISITVRSYTHLAVEEERI